MLLTLLLKVTGNLINAWKVAMIRSRQDIKASSEIVSKVLIIASLADKYEKRANPLNFFSNEEFMNLKTKHH